MRYLSVCAGIEAATVAWHGMGWEAAAYSEIEPFPSAVLAHHYPDVPNVGDMTKYKEWDIGAIDLVVGGTPCQSFSVAGLRKGLEDPRGNLALVYCGILDHFRPQWCVWENVPGVLSSNGGRDFGSFLGALAELGYGFAYRVLDAQYFGVAQRRRRVFVVGHLGDWQPAAAVLFESESLRRDTAPSRQKGQDTATSSVAGTLDSRHAGGFQSVQSAGAGRLGAVETPEVMCTPRATGAGFDRPGNAATEHETYIPMAQPIAFQSVDFGGDASTDLSPTLRRHDPMAVMQPQGVVQPITAAFKGGQGSGAGGIGYSERVAPTLSASDGGNRTPTLLNGMAVRRLTPVECERLQGFPDDYTAIPWRGKEAPDGPRYKALGNSMAVPVMRWIGERINAQKP
jgi:DNA (cytosine-5)-methyltransferase 1